MPSEENMDDVRRPLREERLGSLAMMRFAAARQASGVKVLVRMAVLGTFMLLFIIAEKAFMSRPASRGKHGKV